MRYSMSFPMSLFLCLLLGLSLTPAFAREFKPNYDESEMPDYELPNPLVCSDGTKVKDEQTWKQKRQPEILALFEKHVYGKTPAKKFDLDFECKTDTDALDGKAIRKQITLYPVGKENDFKASLLIYLPKQAEKPVPAFTGLNFRGNQTVHEDPGIVITDNMIQLNKVRAKVRGREAQDIESTRGASASRWQVEKILDRGYALATMWYYEIDPDYDDGFENGIHPFFYDEGQTKPKPDEWGSIGAWAWGLSRIMDYFEEDEDIDHKHIAVMGHSRLGKTSLWCGAQDERFAIVISNDSGCGGAALSRRAFGETVGRINQSFPHWFCDNFNQYNQNEDELPVDQHMLIALMAPRPVYVASAEEDRWADPRGEFLSAKHADPVYKLFGLPGIEVGQMPPVNHPVGKTIGYHIRTGRHNVTEYDWEQYLNFADQHFGR